MEPTRNIRSLSNEWLYQLNGATPVGLSGANVPVDQGANTPYLDVPMQVAFAGNYNITVQHTDIEVVLKQVRLGDITIKLVSSSGETSILLSRPTSATDKLGNTVSNTETPDDYSFTYDTVKDWGEIGLQDYHIVISYAVRATPTGQIGGVSTTVYGDPIVPGNTNYPDNYIYTDEFGQLSSDPKNGARSTLTDINTVVLNAAAVSTGTVLDLHAGSTDSVIAGRSLTIGAGTIITAAYGGAGNDTIIGNNAGDLIYGGQGNDIITGGTGNDAIEGMGGADTLNGGGGINTVFYTDSTTGATINLATGTDSTGSTLSNFLNIIGSNYGDTMIGNSGANVITGGSGNNTIEGMGGADTLNGGVGGTNTVSYAWSTTGVTANLTTGIDSTGSTLSNFQNIIGSNCGDTMVVGGGVHTLVGGTGNDTLEVSNLAAGSVIQGGGGTNILVVNNGDISQASISGVQILQVNGSATLSVAQMTTANITISGISSAYTLTVSDTSANVVANLAILDILASSGQITSIVLKDATTPTFMLAATQLLGDASALAKIIGPYNVAVYGVKAFNAARFSSMPHVTSLAVSDTPVDVIANLPTLETLASGGQLISITLTGSKAPIVDLTAAQALSNAAAVAKIGGAYNEFVFGVLAVNAASVTAQPHVTLIGVSDLAVNVLANMASLQTLAAGGQLDSIILADTTIPTMVFTAAQALNYAAVLEKIISPYNMTVNDTAANVLANIASLQALAAGGQLTSITLTDATTPTLSLTAAQL